jgi:hypothetical protein
MSVVTPARTGEKGTSNAIDAVLRIRFYSAHSLCRILEGHGFIVQHMRCLGRS